jgi:hypothetical protein
MKILRAAPGDGLQSNHYDIEQYDHASKCYSLLFYCTPTNATAVPIHSADVMRPAIRSGKRISEAEQRENNELCNDNTIVSARVDAEQVMVFNASVAHRGVTNTHETDDRVVLYILYSPIKALNQGKRQRYPNGAIDIVKKEIRLHTSQYPTHSTPNTQQYWPWQMQFVKH